MNHPSRLERVWYESVVPVFLERFLLTVCAAAFFGLIVVNSMNLDGPQRISLGIAIIAAAYFVGHTVHKFNQAKSPLLPIKAAVSTPIAPQEQPAPAPSVPGRLFLPDDITPQYLCGLYRDHTAVQADRLASPYQGKWMKVSGSVDDIRAEYDAFVITIWIVRGELIANVRFDKRRWADRVSMLKQGSEIKVTGKLQTIGQHAVFLIKCEL